MSDVQITVTSKLPPFAAGKPGKVIDHTGKSWGAFRPLWDQMYEGSTYVIQNYTTFQGNNGQTYYTIRQMQPAGNGLLQSTQMTTAAPPIRLVPPAPPPNDNQRRMDIFICGAFNNWIRTADPTSSQMEYIDQLHKFKSAWMAVFGPSPLPPRQPQRQDPISSGPMEPHNSDMGDDIPF